MTATHSKTAKLTTFLAIAVTGCAVDLYTKSIVFAWLGPPSLTVNNTWWLWEPYVGIQTAVNHGALFGMAQGQILVFVIVSMVAMIGIAWWTWFGEGLANWWMTVAIGMILGGIWGNLYDRLGFWGHVGVRDWILFRYHQYVWPNFNIADSLLVVGVGIMVWQSFQLERLAKSAPATRDKNSP